MTKHDFLKPALTGLAKLQFALDKKGGPAADGEMFELILELQDGILNSFGLPINPNNEKLLWFDSLPTDYEVEKRVGILHKTATNYLLSNAKPELQILTDAQELNQDPYIVLPELKLPTHCYTLFVYNNILLKKRDAIENILHELKFVNRPDFLDAIGNLEQNNIENAAEVIQILKESGVKYIEQFMNSNSNH